MAETPSFHTQVRQLLRERVIQTARELVCTEGWGAVTMSRVAKEVGVSRPVLYKEIGTRQELAEVVIRHEVDTFLAGIDDCLDAHPADLVSGIVAAVEYTLHTTADNTLVKAILAGRSDSDTALLPSLMTDPEPVLRRAIVAIDAALAARYADLLPADGPADRLETVIRLTLSHAFQPTGPVERAVGQITLVATILFAPGD